MTRQTYRLAEAERLIDEMLALLKEWVSGKINGVQAYDDWLERVKAAIAKAEAE